MTSTDSGTARGLRWILLATVIAGGLGYVIQLVAPRLLDGTAYIAFSVVWSTVYLCVSAMSGVQQEVTRAAHSSTAHDPNTVLRTFTIAAGGVMVIVSVVLGLILGVDAVPIHGLELSAALALALVGYLLTAVLSGVLYGLRLWRQVALLTILDATFRTVGLMFAFLLGLPADWLAFGIAFPFGFTFLIVWLLSRRLVIGRFVLDVPLRTLARNVLSTVGAATCTGAMISGLPLLLGLTSTNDDAHALGAVMLAITLSRAPIVVPILALQSFLISAVFRGRSRVRPRRLLRLIATATGAILALAGIAYVIGPPLIRFISLGRYEIDSATMAIIVMSAGIVGLMCVTGPALVAERQHGMNVAGWATSAALTIGCLLLPSPLLIRIDVALIAPPLIGLTMHVIALLRPALSPKAPSGLRATDSAPLD